MENDKTPKNLSQSYQICTFWLAERLYGVDILDIKEINTETSFTPVFHAPPTVKGYVNIRGQIHLVLNLRKILECDAPSRETEEKILIFKPTVAEPFGVMVDRIGDIFEVSSQQIESPIKTVNLSEGENGNLNISEGLILGICKLKDQLLVILNPRDFLRHVAMEGKRP